jgi:hypothetical protein
MDTLQERIDFYQRLLKVIAGPAFVIQQSPHVDPRLQFPFRWACLAATEPMEFVTTIKFSKDDELKVIGRSEDQLIEYLRERYGHLFERR